MVDLKGKTLYEALGVEKTASQAEIRKAFHKLALALHPDKNPGDASAVEKFQTLQKVYGILSDPDKRKVYDQTGSIEDSEELAGEQFNQLYEYYRSMYAPVTEEDLDAFHTQFRGGDEERGEVLKYYQQFKGDMGKVFEWVMCSDESTDSHRFMDLLNAAIKAKEVPSFPKYAAWAKRVAARPRPKEGVSGKGGRGSKGRGGKQAAEEEGSQAALVAAIRGRQQGALARLGGGGGVLGSLLAQMGGDEEDMPSEEDFLAARQRLEQRGSGGSGKKVGSSGSKKSGGGGGSNGSRKSGARGSGSKKSDEGGKQKAAGAAAGSSPSKRAKKK